MRRPFNRYRPRPFSAGRPEGTPWSRRSRSSLDLLGFKMLNQRSPQAAIAVWELEAQEFPKSWHAYDSLGLGYRIVKDPDRSLTNYRKSLTLNPPDENAKKA